MPVPERRKPSDLPIEPPVSAGILNRRCGGTERIVVNRVYELDPDRCLDALLRVLTTPAEMAPDEI